jgi:hypothetical protein
MIQCHFEGGAGAIRSTRANALHPYPDVPLYNSTFHGGLVGGPTLVAAGDNVQVH